MLVSNEFVTETLTESNMIDAEDFFARYEEESQLSDEEDFIPEFIASWTEGGVA